MNHPTRAFVDTVKTQVIQRKVHLEQVKRARRAALERRYPTIEGEQLTEKLNKEFEEIDDIKRLLRVLAGF